MNDFKYAYLKNLLPVEFCHFFTHVLMRYNEYKNDDFVDMQMPDSLVSLPNSYMFETAQERIWPTIEEILGEELIPTYSFARLYINDNTLEKHTDNSDCEISVSIQLGRSHHYSWPLYIEDQRFDLAEGDGIIYLGELEHHRNICDGPVGYYSGQVFFHFVRKNGPYADVGVNSSKRITPSFIRNRTVVMESK